jgi:hypothetical protein
MFEAFRWHNKSYFDPGTAMQSAADSLAQAGKAPLVIGSIAAMAVLGLLTRMRLNHKGGRSRRATVIPARFRASVEDAVSSAPRNGRRRRKRKMKAKAAAH